MARTLRQLYERPCGLPFPDPCPVCQKQGRAACPEHKGGRFDPPSIDPTVRLDQMLTGLAEALVDG